MNFFENGCCYPYQPAALGASGGDFTDPHGNELNPGPPGGVQ
jgi:hypothetical protein